MSDCFSIIVYSDNFPGLLHRITAIFTRRKLNIESLTVSNTEVPGISRYTIVINSGREVADKVAQQIRKVIEVHEVCVIPDPETVNREVALIKVQNSAALRESTVMRELGLTRIHEDQDVQLFQMTGTPSQIDGAVQALSSFEIVEFVRSGRISMRPEKRGACEFVGAPPEAHFVPADEWI
jgi:acetolactate synthase-1/3 small subunit